MTEKLPDVAANTLHLWKATYYGEPRLYIRCQSKDRLKAKGLPGSLWDGVTKAYHVPFSPVSVKPLLDAFPGYEYKRTDSVAYLFEGAKKFEEISKVTELDDLDDLPTKTTAALHQRKMYHTARLHQGFGVWMEMGGGKSIVAVGLMDDAEDKLVLIQCPKNVVGVWPREFRKHSTRDWNIWTSPETGTVARKASDLATWLTTRDPRNRPRAVIVNYDSAWRPGMADMLLGQRWDTEILDESHKIKAPGGKASRFCAKIKAQCGRVFELTGTPEPHGPEDLYGQFRAMDSRIFGTNYNQFKNRYFKLRPINDKVTIVKGFIDEEAQDKFVKKVKQVSLWIPKSDFTPIPGGFDASTVWSLPAVDRLVTLDPKTWRAYQSLKRDFVAEVDAGIVSADNVLTKLLRLRQITSGHVRVEDENGQPGETVTIGVEKRSALAEVLDDIPSGEPVVVFGVFHHDLDAIRYVAEEAGRAPLELSGRKRDGLRDDATMAGDANEVLAVQLQSGGVGIDLTRACYVVNYSLDYNLGNILQSRARYDRPGQSRPVTVINLIAVGPTGAETVDGATYRAIEERQQVNEAVLNELRMRRI